MDSVVDPQTKTDLETTDAQMRDNSTSTYRNAAPPPFFLFDIQDS